jgi:hypothetical protein
MSLVDEEIAEKEKEVVRIGFCFENSGLLTPAKNGKEAKEDNTQRPLIS